MQGTHVASDIMYVVVGAHMASTQPESTTPPVYSEYTSIHLRGVNGEVVELAERRHAEVEIQHCVCELEVPAISDCFESIHIESHEITSHQKQRKRKYSTHARGADAVGVADAAGCDPRGSCAREVVRRVENAQPDERVVRIVFRVRAARRRLRRKAERFCTAQARWCRPFASRCRDFGVDGI